MSARIARHAEAEDQDRRSRRRRSRSSTVVGVAQFGSMRAASMVRRKSKMPTMSDQRRVLEQADEGVDDVRDDDLQRLRQDDEPHHLPVAEAERHGALVLALRDGLQAAAHHLGHVGRRRTARRRPARAAACRATSQSGTNSGSMTLAMNSTVISGTPRTNSMKIDAEQLTDGMRRAAAERQQDAERQRERRCRPTTPAMVTRTPPHRLVSTTGRPSSGQPCSRTKRHDRDRR